MIPAGVPPFFSRGPLCQLGALYGWGRGALSMPGQGTQSWLFCPLISLGLALSEERSGTALWSTGRRAIVPAPQVAFWRDCAMHIIVAYADWFASISPGSGIAAR